MCNNSKSRSWNFGMQEVPQKDLENDLEFPDATIEQNETKEEALIREIREELKFDIEAIR